MRTPNWQIYLFTIQTIITLPFYTTLIVSLIVWRRRNNVFRSPYYTITLAQVLPDFLIVATYLLFWMAKFLHIGNEFVFKYQDYFFADYIMIQAPLLLIMKAFAVAAIAIQRYISLCCHTSWLHQKVTKCPPWIIYLVIWGPPILICSPIWINSEAKIIDSETLTFIVPETVTRISAMTNLLTLTPIFFIVFLLYARIFEYLVVNRELLKRLSLIMILKLFENWKSDKKLNQERRLSFQVLPLIFSFVLIYAYAVACLIINELGRPDLLIAYMHPNYPVIMSTFAFINPWTLLILNSDVRRNLFGSSNTNFLVLPDFLIVATYLLLWMARFFHIGNEFVFKYQDYFFADYIMVQSTLLLIMKAFAVAAIAIQRYISLCCHTSWLHQKMTACPPWIIYLVIWGPPILICSPIWIIGEGKIVDSETLTFNVPESVSRMSSIINLLTMTPIFFIVFLLYARIFKYLIVNRELLKRKSDKKLNQERRLSLQVFPLVLAFVVIYATNVVALILGQLGRLDLISAYVYPSYPVIMSTFAFINPWTLLILNSDVRRNLFGSQNSSFPETSSRPAVQAIRVMLTPTWQNYLFAIETIFTVPFYTTLTVSLIVWRRGNPVFRSPYYTMTLAQVLPDFLIVATYSLLWTARFFHIGNEFVFKYQEYFFAKHIMIQPTLLLIMKAFAVAAIAIQRYISLCCHTSWLHQKVTKCPPWIIYLVIWGPPILICTPIWIIGEGKFVDSETLAFSAPEFVSKMCSMTNLLTLTPNFFIVFLLYARIFKYLVVNRELMKRKSDKKLNQERRLSLQVFPLVFAFVFIYAINVFSLIISQLGRLDLLSTYVFPNYAVIMSNFAFINPWTLLILNSDVRRNLFGSSNTNFLVTFREFYRS
ncbi:unnamed protein product [Caenorhabditis auriculariae]|uniref:G-protein coupled receptors family 1 profile domain-containing protein n=1 Tax=Caenorhabditis auriculariae TaxID=2777116 RepID=A0A8S1HNW1_9PELO|nr:unnamed protein product [Caenorhabditis auriculariae]